MPKFIATGSHELKGVRYRFMVMERFGEDLQKKFEADGKTFPRKSVLQMGLRIVSIHMRTLSCCEHDFPVQCVPSIWE